MKYAIFRALLAVALLVGLTACTPRNLDQPPSELGDFRLGHNVVIASKMQKGPVSRDATEDEWTTALKSALEQRFRRYDGNKLYHFGISVEGYMLAPKGVPLLYTPKSALVIKASVWDDASNQKLNAEPVLLTVLEDTNEDSLFIGSGWGRTRQQQLDMLSYNAAYAVEEWLVKNHKTLNWFTGQPPRQQNPQIGGF